MSDIDATAGSTPPAVLLVAADRYTIRACDRLGVDAVVVYGQGSVDAGHVHVPEHMTGVFVEDQKDAEAVLGALFRAGLGGRHFDAVISANEYAIPLAALLARFFGARGLSPEVAIRFRDKSLQKRLVGAAGIPVARHLVIDDIHRLDEFTGQLTGPMVLKPVAGVGTRLTTIVHDLTELRAAASRIIAQTDLRTFILEEFIAADEWIVDGVVRDGELAFHSMGYYPEPCLATVQRQKPMVYGRFDPVADKDIFDDGAALARRAIAALGMTDGVFHLEVFRPADGGPLVFGECAARRGAAMIFEEVLWKFNVDLAEETVRAALGWPPKLDVKVRPGAIGTTNLLSPPGVIVSCPPVADILARNGAVYARIEMPVGATIADRIPDAASRLGQVLVRADDRDQLAGRLADIRDWFGDQLVVVPANATNRALRAWQLSTWPASQVGDEQLFEPDDADDEESPVSEQQEQARDRAPRGQAAPGPEQDNYVLAALDLFARYGDAEAIVQGGRRLSYTEVANLTRSLAAALLEAGVEQGAGVAVLVSDCPEAASLQLALHLLGCRTVWIVPYAPRRDQLAYLELAKPEALIYSPASERLSGLAAEVIQRDPGIKVLSMGESEQHQNLFAGARDGSAEIPPGLVGPQPASLFYTGGTTGQPKLVHHWQGFYKMLLAISAYYRSVNEPPMRFLSGSSFSYTSGQMPAFLTLFQGGTFFITEDWDIAGWLETIEKERISSTFLTPYLLYKVIEHPGARNTDTSSLRYLNVGGAAASPARLDEAIGVFGPVLRIVYGSSELPLIADLPFLDRDPEHPERLKSAGKPFFGTEIEIRDEQGNVQGTGESGEVWIKGPLAMAGYWQQPELTRETMSAGWVRTGDVGYLDADGFLYLVDRVSDMIVTSGAAANVYAKPIEDVLTSHPRVRAAAVIGIPDEDYGEAVYAYAVTEPGAQVTGEELRDLVRNELNALYTPRQVQFVDELPLTSIAKVDKKELRKRYLAEHGTAPGPA